MLFCLSLCDETHRVILDQDNHGTTLCMVEGRDWQEAREAAIRNPVMDGFTYVAGHGWYASEALFNRQMEGNTQAPAEH